MDRESEHNPARQDQMASTVPPAELSLTSREGTSRGGHVELPVTKQDQRCRNDGLESAALDKHSQGAPGGATGQKSHNLADTEITTAVNSKATKPVHVQASAKPESGKDAVGKGSNINSPSKAADSPGPPIRTKFMPPENLSTSTAISSSKAAEVSQAMEQPPKKSRRTAQTQAKTVTDQSSSSNRPASMATRSRIVAQKPLGSLHGAPKGSSDGSFVKPKPKSPTKPLRLPSSLTAPTASSVSKAAGPRQSLSRQSGNVSNATTTSARTSLPSTATSKVNVQRRDQVSSRPRPSLGRPPANVPRDDTKFQRPSNVDSGFLARMTRPTQSSSSRTAEKGQTPPKRSAPRPKSSSRSLPKAMDTVKSGQEIAHAALESRQVAKIATTGSPQETSAGPEGTLPGSVPASPSTAHNSQSPEEASIHHGGMDVDMSQGDLENPAEPTENAEAAEAVEAAEAATAIAESEPQELDEAPVDGEAMPAVVRTPTNVDSPVSTQIQSVESTMREHPAEFDSVEPHKHLAQIPREQAAVPTSRDKAETGPVVTVDSDKAASTAVDHPVSSDDVEMEILGCDNVATEESVASHAISGDPRQNSSESACSTEMQRLDINESNNLEGVKNAVKLEAESHPESFHVDLEPTAEGCNTSADRFAQDYPTEPEGYTDAETQPGNGLSPADQGE